MIAKKSCFFLQCNLLMKHQVERNVSGNCQSVPLEEFLTDFLAKNFILFCLSDTHPYCFQIVLTEAQESVKQQYGAIREALDQEEQSALQCIFKEERRVLGGLEDKLSFLQKTLQSIQNGLHTLEGLADSKGDKGVKDQLFIMVS